jgi:hypothetical protein
MKRCVSNGAPLNSALTVSPGTKRRLGFKINVRESVAMMIRPVTRPDLFPITLNFADATSDWVNGFSNRIAIVSHLGYSNHRRAHRLR